MRAVAVVALLLTAALAGCSGGSKAKTEPTADLSETHGSLEGLVTDDEAQPVAEAEIGIKAAKASPIQIRILTNSEGRFKIENVPMGRQTITASHAGYDDVSTGVEVKPGEAAVVRLVLVAKPVYEYKIVGLQPLSGEYTCAVEYFQASGECDFEVRNTTGQNVLEDTHNHTFQVPAGWGGLLFEVQWTYGVQPVGVEGIRFHIESQEDLGGKFLKLEARSNPMRVEINQGEVAPDATLGYPIPSRGVPTWVNILPLGTADGAACAYGPCFGGGAAIQLSYDIYVTVFYGGRVDPDYKSPLK